MSILRKNKRLFAEVLSDLKNHVDLSLLTIEPIIQKHVENRAKHLATKTFSYILEFTMYLLALACFVGVFLLMAISPFYVLDEMANKRVVLEAIGQGDIETFTLAIRLMFAMFSVLFIIIGGLLRRNRIQKASIYSSAQELRQIEDHLKSGSKDLSLIDNNYSELESQKEESDEEHA